jgi:hypothetical protein
MFKLGGKLEGSAGLAPAAPGPATPSALDDTRTMMFAALLLLLFMSLQVLVFAVVAIGGLEALATLGSTLSWMWREAWHFAGVATIPLFASLAALALSSTIVAWHRKRWIALPRRLLVWSLRTRRDAARVAFFSGLVQLVSSFYPLDLGTTPPQDGIVPPSNVTTLMYGSSLVGAGVLLLSWMTRGLLTRPARRPCVAPQTLPRVVARVRLERRRGRCSRRTLRSRCRKLVRIAYDREASAP